MLADPRFARYIAMRDRQRAQEVARTLDGLSERELSLVKEAAVMGYVQGVQAGLARDTDIPADSAIAHRVLEGCIAMPDLYPHLSAGESANPVEEEDTDV